jgi:hypothetical protein
VLRWRGMMPGRRGGGHRRKRVLGMVGAAALVLPTLARAQSTGSAEDYTVRLEYLFWKPAPRGELQKGLGSAEGTLLDAEADLGLASAKTNSLRGTIRLGGSWKLRASWAPLDFAGDQAAPRPFSYGTMVARSGDRVVTSIKGNYVTTDLEWDFSRRPTGFLGVLAGVRLFDVDTLVLNVDTESRVADTHRVPVPVVGLVSRTYAGRHLSFEGEITGMTIGSRGHLWEWLLAARVHLSDHLAVTGGYHTLRIEGQNERDFLSLRLGTWTFGAEISL